MISTYAELQANIIKWLGRTTDPELPPMVPTFIFLFESIARRRLNSRVGEIRSVNSSIVAEYTQLPTDFIKVVGAKRVSPQPGPLKVVSDAAMSAFGEKTGTPTHVAIGQRSLRLHPVPSTTTIVQLTYTRLPALSVSAPTNWLLDLSPDVYLFGALAVAAEHYGDDRKQAWEAKSYGLLEDLNMASRPAISAADIQPVVVGGVV